MLIEWTNTIQVLNEFAIRLRNTYQDKLIQDDKIATGNLLNSVEYIVQKDGQAVSVSLQLEDYYKWVEEGRKPGKFPPVDKMLEYIRVKPIIPDERNGRIPDEKQLAFLIARSIAGKSPNQADLANPEGGIKPGYQLRDSIKETMEDFESAIEEAVRKDVSAYIDILFTEFL